MALDHEHCVSCHGGVDPLKDEAIQAILAEAQLESWKVIEGHHLRKTYDFGDFAGALAFVNRIGALAEEEGHHPNICLSWGWVQIEIWTHSVDGLTQNDFVLATKIDRIPTGVGS